MEAVCRRAEVSSVLVALSDDGVNMIYAQQKKVRQKGEAISKTWPMERAGHAVADYCTLTE
jgi:hypothetical protein